MEESFRFWDDLDSGLGIFLNDTTALHGHSLCGATSFLRLCRGTSQELEPGLKVLTRDPT